MSCTRSGCKGTVALYEQWHLKERVLDAHLNLNQQR